MAWVVLPQPSETDGIAHVWHSAGRWLLRDLPRSNYYRSPADLSGLVPTAEPLGEYGQVADYAGSVASDGARWYAAGYWGLARSTDGLIGAAWESVSIMGSLVTVTGNAGTIVVVNIGGYAQVSNNAGASWLPAPGFPAFGDPARWGGAHTGTHFVLWADSTSLLVSADNGATWVTRTAPIAVAEFAGIDGAWLIAPAGAGVAYVSTDAGVSWAPAAGLSAVARRVVAADGYIYQFEPGTPALQRTADLAAWGNIGLPSISPAPTLIAAGSGNVVLWAPTAGALPHYNDDPAPTPDGIDLPLRLSVQAPSPIDLPLRLSIGIAAAAIDLPVRLSVLANTVLGGLDGAAGWAAAPDGLWRAVVVLGHDDISDRVGPVSVQIAADAARTASFSFRPLVALQPMALIGRRVRIAFAQAGGQNAQAVFAGVVDVPSVDLQTGMITCDCTDQAQHVWSNTARADIDALVGGRWHVAVSGEPEDNFAYLRERIQSVPASWALDVQQRPRILPWRSPARTVTVRTADVIDGSLAADLPSREQLRSRIVCRMQYRYPALRYRVALAQYSQPLGFFLPELGAGTPGPSKQWLTRGMVESATERMPGWELLSRSVEHPPARSWLLGSGAVYSISPHVAPTLALGFAARYRARWRQSVTQDYTLTVVWPWLESQLPAPAAEEIGATIDAQFEVPGWDSDPSVQPLGSIDAPGDQVIPWHPLGAAPADRDAAIGALLDRAWVKLWAASRSGRVRFALPCRPDMWLDWRVTLEHAALRAAGDVVEIEHTLDNQSGEAVTTVALAVGLPGNAAAAAPVWPTIPAPSPVPPPADSAYSFEIGTYVGGEAGAAPFDESSMIGFATNIETPVEGAPLYPHQLSIRAPALTAADRDPASAAVRLSIAVDVPTDLLEIPV